MRKTLKNPKYPDTSNKEKTDIHKITNHMPSGTLGEILLQIEPVVGLHEWNYIIVLKCVRSF